MKKYFPYIGIIFVLLVVALYFFFQDNSRTLNVDYRYFSVPDTSEITTIRVFNTKDTLLLQKSNNNWLVNNKYQAKSKVIRHLLGMFSTIEIQSPAPGPIKNDVIKEFSLHSLTITFLRGTKTIKSFKLLDSDTFRIGTFALMEGENEPFIIRIPGYDGRISGLFPTNQHIWRDHIVFHYLPYEILNVRVDYPESQAKSFIMDLKDQSEIVVSSLTRSLSTEISKEKAISYLYNFNSVPFEFISGNIKELRDSINKVVAFCIITMHDITGNGVILKTYRIPDSAAKEKFNIYKMYAELQNDTIPVIIKYADFDPIMKEYNDFLSK